MSDATRAYLDAQMLAIGAGLIGGIVLSVSIAALALVVRWLVGKVAATLSTAVGILRRDVAAVSGVDMRTSSSRAAGNDDASRCSTMRADEVAPATAPTLVTVIDGAAASPYQNGPQRVVNPPRPPRYQPTPSDVAAATLCERHARGLYRLDATTCALLGEGIISDAYQPR